MALRGRVELPEGLTYRDEFVTPAEELGLIELAAGLDMHHVVIRDQPSRRLVRHFGYGYDYESSRVREGEPIPYELEPLRRRAEEFAGLDDGSFVEALVTFYPVGAGINWHRDAPAFGDRIVGVSLGAPSRMQLRAGEGQDRRVYEQVLEPRSAYLLSGPARRVWQHHIPPTRGDRYSVTFRTLRRARAAA
ncbi:MAG: alpha-ketoglutarate-dependent dioxygenase AlkB [Actinobacteria bacterium]|nr:alpha-ketoglutarate-dependent dioxygenase AlkB [Actinomycetota bacterium]